MHRMCLAEEVDEKEFYTFSKNVKAGFVSGFVSGFGRREINGFILSGC